MKSKAIISIISTLLLTGVVRTVTPLAERAHASAVVLSVGMTGTEVSMLQSDLKKLSYFTYPAATGYYGSITRDAVTAFQNEYLLPADGIAGPITREALRHAIIKQQLVNDTYSYISTRYVWGSANPAVGFDCSGFIYYMFSKFGVPMIRSTSANLFMQGISINKPLLRPGDLVFFRNSTSGVIDHVGFYTGGGAFISATSSKGIYVQQLDNTYWGPRYAGARRVF